MNTSKYVSGSSASCSQISNTVNSKYCGFYLNPSDAAAAAINVPICGKKLNNFILKNPNNFSGIIDKKMGEDRNQRSIDV